VRAKPAPRAAARLPWAWGWRALLLVVCALLTLPPLSLAAAHATSSDAHAASPCTDLAPTTRDHARLPPPPSAAVPACAFKWRRRRACESSSATSGGDVRRRLLLPRALRSWRLWLI
jgi:hypothetical protein